jgi:hypothetical protein
VSAVSVGNNRAVISPKIDISFKTAKPDYQQQAIKVLRVFAVIVR